VDPIAQGWLKSALNNRRSVASYVYAGEPWHVLGS